MPPEAAGVLTLALAPAVRLVYSGQQRRPRGWLRTIWRRSVGEMFGWFTTTRPQAAWLAIHRAEEALLLVGRDDYVVSQAIALQRKWAEPGFPSNDPTSARYGAFLRHFLPRNGGRPSRVVTQPEREELRAITYQVNNSSETADENLHSFRNQLMALGALMLVGVAGTLTMSLIAPGLLGISPTPGRWDVLIALVAGSLGGLVSAVYVFRSLQSYRNPYAIQLVQALIKLPFGAVVGYWGALLVERGVFGLFQPQVGAQAICVSFLFGFAQQAVSRSLDKRADKLLGQVQTASPMTPQRRQDAPPLGAELVPTLAN